MENLVIDGATLVPFRLLMDTAALVLIWIIQLVVYPSLCYYSSSDLRRWHPVYTRKITIVVLPIMCGQLVTYAAALVVQPDVAVCINASLVAGTWLITFALAVPLHQRLDTSPDPVALAVDLVRINKWRTALWSAVWIMTVYTAANSTS